MTASGPVPALCKNEIWVGKPAQRSLLVNGCAVVWSETRRLNDAPTAHRHSRCVKFFENPNGCASERTFARSAGAACSQGVAEREARPRAAARRSAGAVGRHERLVRASMRARGRPRSSVPRACAGALGYATTSTYDGVGSRSS